MHFEYVAQIKELKYEIVAGKISVEEQSLLLFNLWRMQARLISSQLVVSGAELMMVRSLNDSHVDMINLFTYDSSTFLFFFLFFKSNMAICTFNIIYAYTVYLGIFIGFRQVCRFVLWTLLYCLTLY